MGGERKPRLLLLVVAVLLLPELHCDPGEPPGLDKQLQMQQEATTQVGHGWYLYSALPYLILPRAGRRW